MVALAGVNLGGSSPKVVIVKGAVAVLALVLACLAAGGAAHAQNTANELLQDCEILERTLVIQGDLTSYVTSHEADICWAYMMAFLDLSAFQGQSGQPALKFCPPSGVTLTQYIRILTNYARAHPEQLHQRAGFVALNAMFKAFPCSVR